MGMDMRVITQNSFKLGAMLVCSLLTQQTFAWGLSGELIASQPKAHDYDGLTFDNYGLGGSIDFGQFDSGVTSHLKAEYQQGSGKAHGHDLDIKYYEGSANLGIMTWQQDNMTLRLKMGLGVSYADYKVKTATANMTGHEVYGVLPLGLEAGYLIPTINMSLFANAGYKLTKDLTGNQNTCADGYKAHRNDYDVCNGHGGVNNYSDFMLGNLSGFQMGVGARLHY